jgi:regulator of protease activity HflC (stomatin/prohibitin superfamily)
MPDPMAQQRKYMTEYDRSGFSRIARTALPAILGLVVLVLFMQWFVLDWKIIPPGYTGVKINRLVDQGITRSNTVTGFVFYNPIQTQIVVYPTFIQRVAWTRDLHEGNPVNEELTFNTKDAVPVTLDVAVSYALDAAQVPAFYTKFRADRLETFTHGYLRDTARNVVVSVGSEYNFDDINGVKKEEFLDRITREMNQRVAGFGVSVQQFGLIGALRPPPSLLDAVNLKTRAIQESIRAENEVRTAEAEAKKRVAIAEGEAAANRALLLSLDPKLFEWERLKLQHEAIQKWNGVSPTVMGGGTGMLFNIPVQAEK